MVNWTKDAIDYIPTEEAAYEVLYYIVGNENYTNVGSADEPISGGFLSVMEPRDLDLKASKNTHPYGFGYGSPGEVESNLTDLNQGTKLCVTGSQAMTASNPLIVDFKTSDEKEFVLNGKYTMTTGNDTATYWYRNPTGWKIQGFNTATGNWEDIVTETSNTSLPNSNWSKYEFSFTKQNKIYNQLRVSFTRTSKDSQQFQLSEMFFGGKVMKNPSFAFSTNSDILFDDENHAAIAKVGDYVIDYNTVHFLYKKDGAANWTKCTGSGLPQFKDAG